MYGTNIDNVLEEAYKRARPEMSLEPLSAITAEFRERDQYLTRLQYVKLHGSLPCDPHEVTFGTLQFAGRANALDDWWRQFVRDYVHQPTLFVGSDINEPLFWQAIAARGERGSNPEERPQSYLVVPSLSEARRRLLEAYNITHVPATAQDFFAWLAAEYLFPSRESVLSVILPESSELLRNYSNRPTIERALKQLLTVFQRVPEPGQVSSRSKAFLLGAPPDWDDIRAGLDAPREINSYLKTEIEKALAQSQRMQTFALLGEGGSGKSTIARRVAVTLRQEGYEVFYSDGSERVRPHELVQALRTVKSKVLLVVDNAALLGPTIVELIKACLELDIPPILLLASRYIPFEQRLRSYLESDQYREVDVPILSDPDIDNLLATLERHNLLGRLTNLTPTQQRAEVRVRAKKQILVAMREATEGRDFDEIIRHEFAELSDREHRVLFLCAALGTAALVHLTEKQWFDCAEAPPATALRILRRDLRGMVERIGGQAALVAARHPIICDYILGRVAGKEELMEAYRRTLLSVSHDLSNISNRSARPWRLFVRLINHQYIFERFAEAIDYARGVYELTSDAFASDGHFWLQFANLEVDYGKPANARPYLANAEGILGETDLVLNTRAHMMLREALSVASYDDALALRREAEEILTSQIDRAQFEDEYPYHVYLTHMLSWIRQWIADPAQRRRELQSLRDAADDACARMGRNTKLRGVRDAIAREYLSMAIAKASSS